jgi:hypothetical protein
MCVEETVLVVEVLWGLAGKEVDLGARDERVVEQRAIVCVGALGYGRLIPR